MVALQGGFVMGSEFNPSVEFYVSDDRAVFFPDQFHVSRSLRRRARTTPFEIRFDTAFESVMIACRRPVGENWITPDIIRVYSELHERRQAHSIEVWLGDALVGGTYGIAMGQAFIAESMFHTATDASKIALWALTQTAFRDGFLFVDAQVQNPHLESLGARSLSHVQYMECLLQALYEGEDSPWSNKNHSPAPRPASDLLFSLESD